MCRWIFLSNLNFSTILFDTHVLQHQFNFHHSTSWIKWFFPIFFKNYELDQNFELSSNSFKLILIHVTFIYKWSFWDGFWTPKRLFSPKRLCKWIPTIVSTLLSYHTRSHFTLNYPCFWGGLFHNHDQAFKWNLSHCHGGNVVSIHKLHFMLLISQYFHKFSINLE